MHALKIMQNRVNVHDIYKCICGKLDVIHELSLKNINLDYKMHKNLVLCHLKHKMFPYLGHELHGSHCIMKGIHPSECSSAVSTNLCFCPFYEVIQDTLGLSQPVGVG